MAIEVHFDGIDELNKILERMPKELSAKVNTELGASSLEVETQAKQNLTANKSVITGRLRASINTREQKQLLWTVSTNVEYALSVEFRKPYFFPAMEKKRPQIIRNIREVLRG